MNIEDLVGKFHAHLTLDAPGEMDGLRKYCAGKSIKVTVIDLQGTARSDIMTTHYFMDGKPGAVGRIMAELREKADVLGLAGFIVRRVKLEHESLPSIEPYTRENYREVHVKLEIPADAYEKAKARLFELAPVHGFVPSRNPREANEESVMQLVNFRFYDGTPSEADRKVDEAMAAIGAECGVVKGRRSETVVFDSNIRMDEDWSSFWKGWKGK